MTERNLNPEIDEQSMVNAVINGLDGNVEALDMILNGPGDIFIEQPIEGRTIADPGVIVTVVPWEE